MLGRSRFLETFFIAVCCVFGGALLGSSIGLVIIVTMALAPMVMLLCCIWIGVCTWRATLVQVQHAYGWALSGYTALILVITVLSTPGAIALAPQFVMERGSEIMLGVCCAVIAEVIFCRVQQKRMLMLLSNVYLLHTIR